ncbi:MAG TPA: VC0807 family protein [Acidimicrobiales bacterium]|nr:VC0807 family protein [Acidimicrobiales bacterium]
MTVAVHDAPRHTIHLPAPLVIARTAASHLFEATIAPLAIFYLVMSQLGLHWALIAALAWSYASVIRRMVLGQRLPGLLLMAAGLFTVRTVIAMVTGSTFIYFLQPTLGTFVVAGLFLASVRVGQPLAERLAHDFCPLPDALVRNSAVRRFFLRISLLWAFIYLVNGMTTLLLLLRSSLPTFLVMRTVSSTTLTICAIALSYVWFMRSLRAEGVALRWARSRP